MLDLRGVAEPGPYTPTGGLFNYGVVSRDFGSALRFGFVMGEVVITSIDAERVHGTFSGILEEIVPPLSTKADTVHVTDGRFDLPILDDR